MEKVIKFVFKLIKPYCWGKIDTPENLLRHFNHPITLHGKWEWLQSMVKKILLLWKFLKREFGTKFRLTTVDWCC